MSRVIDNAYQGILFILLPYGNTMSLHNSASVEATKLDKDYPVDQEELLLVKKAIAGEESAFGILMEKYRDKIYRVLFFMVHHQEDALDLLQDTFLKAYKSLPNLRSAASFYGWLVKIAINLALNSLKKKDCMKKHQEKIYYQNSTCAENPVDILQKKELYEQLTQAIAILPPKQKAALILCDVEGYSYKEIAKILKCRLGTVMSRIYYAREQLREQLMEKKEVKSTSQRA